MKTIEERASEYAHTEWISEFTDMAKESYTKGKTEQKAIDNERAKNDFGKACGWLSTCPWYNKILKEFMKAIEEDVV